MPPQLKNAIIAAEDERFYEHPGIDYVGVMRAAYANLVAGGRRQGASTITMQVARNFFLSIEKTLTRKLYEALLAFKIEHSLSKDQILELYVNQIYLGQRAYGFAAASQIYYGKPLSGPDARRGGDARRAAEGAVASTTRSRTRSARSSASSTCSAACTSSGYINDDTVRGRRMKAPLRTRRDVDEFAVHAEYVAEMVRQALDRAVPGRRLQPRVPRLHDDHARRDQEAAYEALRRGVLEYDRRHGYRGPEGYVELPRPHPRRRLRGGAAGVSRTARTCSRLSCSKRVRSR